MPLYPVAGCKIYIGPAIEDKSTDFAAADFTALNFVEITNWTQMGDVGDESSSIVTPLIGEGRDKKQKGTRNAGSMQNVFANNPLDPGQVALKAAEKTLQNYAFKIELNDKPVSGASPKNGLRYFAGLVMSAREAGGAPNTIRTLNAMVEINSNVVTVAPSAT